MNSRKTEGRIGFNINEKKEVRFQVDSAKKVTLSIRLIDSSQRQTVGLDLMMHQPLEMIDFEKVSLEDFDIQEKLGSGSFGHVFKAIFKLNKEVYALKILDKEFIAKVNLQFPFKIQNKK